MHVSNLAAAERFVSMIPEVADIVSLPDRHGSPAEATVPVGRATDEHHHPVAEELYLFQRGKGRLRVAGEERDMQPGDCALIAPRRSTGSSTRRPVAEAAVLLRSPRPSRDTIPTGD